MNNINLIHIAIILTCIYLVHTENYDDITSYYYDRSALVDSESNQVYNISLKEKPIRTRHAEQKSEFDNDKITIDTSQSKDCQSSTLNGNRNFKLSRHSVYPYSVSIQKKGAHYASGALIHNKWILSVAGEFYKVRETIKLFRARLGSVNCKKGGTLVPLKRIEIHPSYVYNQPNFDLAMLRIGQFVQCSINIRPISLSDVKGKIASAKFLTTYWPRLLVQGKVLSQSAKERMKQQSMRVSTQKMIPWNKCYNVMLTYNYTLDESCICLKPIISHHSPCMPDVGAPIIADDGLWGITSGWTPEDCLAHPSPTISTRISLEPTISWLDKLLDEDKK